MENILLQFAIAFTPEVIQFIKDAFKKDNPNVAPPTDEEVIAAFNAAFASSLAKDDQWLAAHPENPPTP